jgi:hypothetical protein
MAGSSANIMILILITRYYRCISKKRRDGEEVIYVILSSAIEPVTRTRLVYASLLLTVC